MRKPIPLLLVLLVATGALAGCTDPPPAPGPSDPVLITDPNDYSYLANDTGAHVHDYWNGAEQLPIIAELEDGFTTTNRWGPTEPIRPLEEMTFPQGTGRVTMTVTWELDSLRSRYDAVELWVKTAADHEPVFLAAVENGDTVEMTVNNTQNDIPHQVLSNWYFVLYYKRPLTDPVMDIRGTHRIDAIAHRTLDIPVFPGHPEHWQDRASLPILYDGHESIAAVHHPRQGGLCTVGNTSLESSCFYTHVPPNGTIIPPETETVEAVLQHDAYPGQSLFLGYHGSGTWAFAIVAPDEVDGGRQVYRIPTTDARPDGPYSMQSQWAFEVYTSGEDDPALRPYTGSYTLTVTAHRGNP